MYWVIWRKEWTSSVSLKQEEKVYVDTEKRANKHLDRLSSTMLWNYTERVSQKEIWWTRRLFLKLDLRKHSFQEKMSNKM